jgi:hypothetical protein
MIAFGQGPDSGVDPECKRMLRAYDNLSLRTPAGKEAACNGISNGVANIERQCASTDHIDKKASFLNTMICLEGARDALGCEDVSAVTGLCDGLLDIEATFVAVDPPEATIQPGESVQLSAEILHDSCSGGTGVQCSIDDDCGDGSSCSCGTEFGNGRWCTVRQVLQGDLDWALLETSVASIDQTGLVIGLDDGIGYAVAISPLIPEILGHSEITVRTPVASVVVEPASSTIQPGESIDLTAHLFSADGEELDPDGRDITWSADDSGAVGLTADAEVATVTGQQAGTATIAATSEGKSGNAEVVVELACPMPPEIPDCSVRDEETRRIVSWGDPDDAPSYSCAYGPSPASWDISLDPDEEVYLEFQMTDCCMECCAGDCGIAKACDTWLGVGAEWWIDDQVGAQLNWNSGADGAGPPSADLRGTLWERGNSGFCGHPTQVNVASLVNSTTCWQAEGVVVRRPGWNQVGYSMADATDIGQGGSYCGSVNETPCGGGSGGGYGLECSPGDPVCSQDPHWKVTLDTGEAVEMAGRFQTGVYGGTAVVLDVYDGNWQWRQRLVWNVIGDGGLERSGSFLNNGPSGTFYLVLNVNGGTPDRIGNELWEYGITYSVKPAGCQ